MKFILFAIIISLFFIAGCGNQSSKEEIHDHSDESTHIHDNGEVHENHDTIQQQEFTIDQDSVMHEPHDNNDSTHSHPH